MPLNHSIIVGFPVEEEKREELRKLGTTALPIVVPQSVKRDCVSCGMPLWVGPRQNATGLPAYCAWCVMKLYKGGDVSIVSLGNPESKLEG